MATVKVTFNADAELYAQFRQVAFIEGRAMSWYLNRAIEKAVQDGQAELSALVAARELHKPKVKKVARRVKK